MLMYQLVAILFTLIIAFLGVILWSVKNLNLDFLDFFKHFNVEDALHVARNKFLDQVRLLAWEIKRKSPEEYEQRLAQEIFQSSNEHFDKCSITGTCMRVELIIAETEEEIEVSEIDLPIPKGMWWKVVRLFTAHRILFFVFDW